MQIKLNLRMFLALLLTCFFFQSTFAQSEYPLSSPDGNFVFHFYNETDQSGATKLFYSVTYKKVPVVNKSRLDLQLDNHLSEQAMALKVDSTKCWFDDLQIVDTQRSDFDGSWTPVHGERSKIRNHYRSLTIKMVKQGNPIYKMNLVIRAYNEGVAFRYDFPLNEKGTYYRITGENDEFALPSGTKAWFTGWAQGAYQLKDLRDWPQESERPLTVVFPNGWYGCLTEAAMTDYARTKFKLDSKRPGSVLTSMYTPADLISPFSTPWRVIMVGEKPGQLLEHNDLILNLNPPTELKDTKWVRPGKIMRVMRQTTKDAFENIDFAARHGLQYILFDWKWYGPAFEFSADATKVAIDDFDLPAIIEYGKKKGIGVWLYVNQQALLMQSDSLFRVYHEWGVKGVKFGFVQAGSHRWTTWLEAAIRKAAENQIMVNIHDDWRPTGEQRTWPNLMTAEGIRGNEEMPDATHNTVLPFTRFICGPADYTICYYDNRIKTTHAHQLALGVVYYSPIQTLYWYDTPERSRDEPELAFWDRLPVSWDETKVLSGVPGSYITVARRKNDEWFIGAITNNDSRKQHINLGFLAAGTKYKATIYYDDDTVATRTKVGIKERIVSSGSVLELPLKASGGAAIWLRAVK